MAANTSSSEKRRAWRGPVLFSHGFRVFFLGAGIWAVAAMAVWVAVLGLGVSLPSRFIGADWHIHALLFGYGFAVLAGFLLTAVPNWTGRLPVIGWPTAGLAALWLLGRLAGLVSGLLPLWLVWAALLVFPIALVLVLAREIIAGRNWRNLKVLIALALFGLAEVLFLAEALNGVALDGLGLRLGAVMIVWLITLIGGRVVPSFTRNWLARQGAGRLPVPFNRFDAGVIVFSSLVMALWVLWPQAALLPLLAALAGALHLIRLSRWVGWRAWSEPLVWVLHLAYLFVVVGFFMLALDPTAVPHGWTAGAVGLMTLAMMSRASLGHSGRMLKASRALTLIYLLAFGAAVLRITALWSPGVLLLAASALFWMLAFGGFVLLFWPLLTRSRQARAA
jgi:uncharacterized protein involved in response to NO